MDNLEKVKKEIERLETNDYPCDTAEQAIGFYDALDRISSFIDSLQAEPTPSFLKALEQCMKAANMVSRDEITEDAVKKSAELLLKSMQAESEIDTEKQYENAKQRVCASCPDHSKECAYLIRGLQNDCTYLSDVMQGYEMCQEDKKKQQPATRNMIAKVQVD